MSFIKTNKDYYIKLIKKMRDLDMPISIEMLNILTEEGLLTYKESLSRLDSYLGRELLNNHNTLTKWLKDNGYYEVKIRLEAYQVLIEETSCEGYAVLDEKANFDIKGEEEQVTLNFLKWSLDSLAIKDLVKYIEHITPKSTLNGIESDNDLDKVLKYIRK